MGREWGGVPGRGGGGEGWILYSLLSKAIQVAPQGLWIVNRQDDEVPWGEAPEP